MACRSAAWFQYSLSLLRSCASECCGLYRSRACTSGPGAGLYKLWYLQSSNATFRMQIHVWWNLKEQILYTNLQCAKLILSHHSPVTGSTPLSVTLSIAMSSVISRKKTLEGRGGERQRSCGSLLWYLWSSQIAWEKKLLGKGIEGELLCPFLHNVI